MAIAGTELGGTPAADLAVCPACGERNTPAARFCGMCGARLAVEEGERKVVTVLFADLSGFTRFSEYADPEAVRALSEAAAGRFGGLVRAHGGVVDKIIGDCVMATFGAATEHEDDPARAVRAAVDMLEYAAEHPAEFAGLSLSIGVHTGEVMYAPVGPQGEHTVLGDTVNIAASLQSLAEAGEVLLGEPTRQAAGEAIDVEPGPPLEGGRRTIATWRARGRADARQARSAFRGRTHELIRLRELWERATTERAAYLVTLTGPPGIGRRRLIEELRAGLGAHRALAGRCLPYGRGIAYWPIAEAIKEAAGIGHEDDRALVSRKLGGLLESLGTEDLDELRTLAVAVANLVAAPATPRGTYRADRIARAELHWGLRRLLELLAADEPILFVLEDLDAGERALPALLTSIVDGSFAGPMLIVATAAPSVVERTPALADPASNRRVIALDALAEDDAAALVAGLGVTGERAAAIVRAGDGVPLYLEEAARLPADEPLPTGVGALVDARLGRASDRARRAAGAAAIVGRVFWLGALAAIEAEPGDALAELEELDLIRRARGSTLPTEIEFAFRHGVVADRAAAMLDGPRRAAAHAAVAGWIATMPGADNELVEIAAYHLEQAATLDPAHHDPGPAIEAMRHAARKTENREGMSEADAWYRRALALAEGHDREAALELLLARARRRADVHDAAGSLELAERVVRAAEASGRSDVLAEALRTQAGLVAQTEPARARELVERARAIAGCGVAFDVELALLSAALHLDAGATDRGLEEFRTAAAHADAAGTELLRIRAHHHLAWALLSDGRLAEPYEHLRTAAELARAQGSLRDEIAATWVLADLTYYLGPREESGTLAARTLTWLERAPDPFIEVRMHERLAVLALDAGDHADAERRMRTAYAAARALGGGTLVRAARRLAQVFLRQGRVRDAERLARICAQHASPGDVAAGTEVALLEAYLAAAQGDDAARAGFEAGLEGLAAEPLVRGETRLLYARALRRLGDEAGARAQLAQARDTFAGLDATAMVEHIDALIAEGAADR